MSTDRRSNRVGARISKLEYLRDYAHCTNINDTNITKKEIVLRKTGTKKKYMTAQRMVYTCPVKKVYQAFVETGFVCSISTFIKYKPFYITAPTEREKESFLFKKCLNASPSCRHKQLPKSPKTSSPYVRHWFLKWPRLAWSQNKISGMLWYQWSFFLHFWKEGGNLFQKWNRKKLRTCRSYR